MSNNNISITLGYAAQGAAALRAAQMAYTEIQQIDREKAIQEAQGNQLIIKSTTQAIQASAHADAIQMKWECASQGAQAGIGAIQFGTEITTQKLNTPYKDASKKISTADNKLKSFNEKVKNTPAETKMTDANLKDEFETTATPEQKNQLKAIQDGNLDIHSEIDEKVLDYAAKHTDTRQKVIKQIKDERTTLGQNRDDIQSNIRSTVNMVQTIGQLLNNVAQSASSGAKSLYASDKGSADATRALAQTAQEALNNAYSQSTQDADKEQQKNNQLFQAIIELGRPPQAA